MIVRWFNVFLCVFYTGLLGLALFTYSLRRKQHGYASGFEQLPDQYREGQKFDDPSLCVPGRGSTCVAPLQVIQSKYRYSQQYRVAACVIEKSMSTVMAAVMCYLHDSGAFTAAGRTLAKETYSERFCKGKNEAYSLANVTRGVKGKPKPKWSYLAVVRDPIERFLSGFIDKCVLERYDRGVKRCYGCSTNMTCFIHKQFERTLNFSRGLHKGGLTYEDIHFYPQNWRCGFRADLDKYSIVHYGGDGEQFLKMTNDILKSLLEAGVPRTKLQWIRDQMINNRTSHATFASPERMKYSEELKSSPSLMRIMNMWFYYDYVLFGFPLPK